MQKRSECLEEFKSGVYEDEYFINILSRSMELFCGHIYFQGVVLSTQRKSKSLLVAWVIMVLSIILLPTVSHAHDGQDFLNAAATGNLSLVRTLRAKGASIDTQDNNGATALYMATQYGNAGIVQALLAALST